MSSNVIEKVDDLIFAYADAIIDGMSAEVVDKFSGVPRAVSAFSALLLARTEAIKDYYFED